MKERSVRVAGRRNENRERTDVHAVLENPRYDTNGVNEAAKTHAGS